MVGARLRWAEKQTGACHKEFGGIPRRLDMRIFDPQEAGMDADRLERALELIRRNAADRTEKFAYPGAVTLIIRRGLPVAYEACGYRSLEPEKVPMTVDTIFDMASITKPVATTSAFLRLLEMGEVLLEDPVSKYLPEFDAPMKDCIALFHLLTHTSGLPASVAIYLHGSTREDAVRSLFSLHLIHRPGERVLYSCMGFIILGLIIEKVTGSDLGTFVRQEVFEPLGMTETGFFTVEECHDRSRIAPTEKRGGGSNGAGILEWMKRSGKFLDRHSSNGIACGAVHDENALAMGGISGNAGLFSTAADIGRFALMYRNSGAMEGKMIFSPSTISLATHNHTMGLGENRGIGWQLKTPGASSSFGNLMSAQAYGHTGFTGTGLWIDPVLDLIVILLTNRVHPSRTNERLMELRPRFVNAVVAAIEP